MSFEDRPDDRSPEQASVFLPAPPVRVPVKTGQKRVAPSGLVFEVIGVAGNVALVKELRNGIWSMWPTEQVETSVLENDPISE